ncbi:molybdate ABC transporter substrate-binding protein [Clostridium coskatii]|uniref:Molybdate-binding periplasmic protein n=1 Tax=Clostridium coskatii TaxID=1705578 RepID=A0A170NN56_9CLOT|nr:molybdate ABC transporter substrate-binding protein [Clostridium coskatii]OAA93259.1 Molybdate-binding periplasmic protein precursor [Clostridium coskatii]OBR95358.1 molybdate-binding periplasmic protein precursor [Clostridium coskatii]
MKSNKLLKFVSSFALSIVLMLGLATPTFAASTGTNSTTTLNLMAAASTSYSLGERVNGVYPSGTLLRTFEDQNPNTKVNVTYDSSGNLLNQMKADPNHSADVFLSADLARMNSAVTANIIQASTVYNLLNNKLMLIANPSTGLTENSLQYSDVLGWLNDNPGTTIAVGDPAVVPAGTYTKQVFDAIDSTTWNDILTHATLYSNVTNVLDAVANNVNQLGSVYATDAKTNSNLIVLDSKDVNIIYPIGVTNAAMNDTVRKPAAQALVDFLKADIAKTDGSSVFRNFGFSPVVQ